MAPSTRRRPVRPEDLRCFQSVSDPQISPDGETVLFRRAVASAEKAGRTDSSIWSVAATGGPPRAFTGGTTDRMARWSPDGTRVAFVRAPTPDTPQVYTMPADGGEATPLTSFPSGDVAAIQWSPDGRSLAVSFREADPDHTEAGRRERERTGASTPPRVLDHLWYRLDGDGYFDGRRFALHLVDARTGASRAVFTRDTLGSFTFDFSPDGRRLAVTANVARDALLKPWKDEIHLVDTRTGKARRLDGPPPGPKTAIAWSPDGTTLAWAGREDRGDGLYSTENLELWLTDVRTGASRSRTGGTDYCLLAATTGDSAEVNFAPSVQWSRDSRRVFTRIGWHGQGRLASIPVRGRTIDFLTTSGETGLGNQSNDGARLALMKLDFTTLAEIHLGTLRSAGRKLASRRLTALNREILAELEIVRPEAHWITSTDGVKVQVWVLRPPRAGRRRTPGVLQVHGGPHAQYGEVFFHEMQLLASAGYTVFMSNPRGSKGYGRDHCAAIRGAWGTKDWEDVQAVADFMADDPTVDPARTAIMGGSYGGYMTNWAIGHTDRFRCAITDRCVSNLLSMAGNSDYADPPDDYWPGAVWDRWETRWEASPIRWLGNASTPTLVIHSEGDLRCNVEQSEQVYTALNILGVPTRFVRYPASTSHGMSRSGPPDLRVHRLHEILGWLDRWIGRSSRSRST